VLCIHGYNDQGPIWQELAQHLVERGRYVVAPDLKGHGLSAHAPHQRGSDLSGFVSDIAAICDTLALRELTLVGHSLGTLIAVALASQLPQRLASLCLVEPVLPPLQGDAAIISAAVDAGSPRRPRPFESEADAEQVFEAFHPLMHPSLRTELVKRTLTRVDGHIVWRTDPHAIGAGRWIYRTEYLTKLSQIRVPSAVIFGANSEVEYSDEYRRALPDALTVSIPGGHWIHYEQPERLAEVISALGQRVSTPEKPTR
jgi:pimeloyl-ACP methyl ester carboxylesterase